ncbi:MAG: DUF2493 domain-containing protein, partial [Desulfobacterales bacterium]|nr:DUF2493 domain-containing protein [Desulfobacterales bacterium]
HYFNIITQIHKIFPITVVISGGATGADKLGEIWAQKRLIHTEIYPADWDKYGKRAGPIRNHHMATKADAAIIYPGGKGSSNMLSQALKEGLPVFVVRDMGWFDSTEPGEQFKA